MKPCAVAICKNHSKTPNISFHRFPRDSELRKIWVLKCRRKDLFNIDTARICSVHFKRKEFERDLRAELLGSRPKPQLKPNVIPTLKLKLEARKVTFAAEPRREQVLEKNENKKHGHFVKTGLKRPSTSSETGMLEKNVKEEHSHFVESGLNRPSTYSEIWMVEKNVKEEHGHFVKSGLNRPSTSSEIGMVEKNVKEKHDGFVKSALNRPSKSSEIMMMEKNEKEKHDRSVESAVNMPLTSSEIGDEVMEYSCDKDLKIYKERFDILLQEKNELEKKLNDTTKELQEAQAAKLEALTLLKSSEHEEEGINAVINKIFTPNDIKMLKEQQKIVQMCKIGLMKKKHLHSAVLE